MPLYLAWVADFWTPFDVVTHAVIDDDMISAEISHAEGEFALASLRYKNPGVGLLKSDRPKIALISWADNDDVPQLIFRGRIVGVPLGLRGAEIEIELSAEPPDAQGLLRKLAFGDPDVPGDEGLAMLPWYDPLFVDALTDPDPAEVLEARPAIWHWSATEGTVSLSNLIEGDAGVVDLGYDYDPDAFDLSIGDPPLTRVDVQVNIEWEQRCRNACEIGDRVAGRNFPTYTPGEFEANWPSIGESIGSNSGWIVTESDTNPQNDQRSGPIPVRKYRRVASPGGANGNIFSTRTEFKSLVRSTFSPVLRVACDYRQPRREVMTASVSIAQQPVFGSDARIEKIELDAQDITVDRITPDWEPKTEYEQGDRVQAQGRVQVCLADHTSTDNFSPWIFPEYYLDPVTTVWEALAETAAPIRRAYRPSYIEQANTDHDGTGDGIDPIETRARQTVSHAILRARALLLSRLRCIQVSASALWQDLALITLDHNIQLQSLGITDPIIGKVVAYTKRWNSPEGQRGVDFTIACCPGTGDPDPEPGEGADQWIEDWATDWTNLTQWSPAPGVVVQLGSQEYPIPPVKQPVVAEDLSKAGYVVISARVANSAGAQEAYVRNAAANYVASMNRDVLETESQPFDLIQPLENVPTQLSIRLRNISAWDTLERKIFASVTELVAPRQINLEG